MTAPANIIGCGPWERRPGVSERIYPFPTNMIGGAYVETACYSSFAQSKAYVTALAQPLSRLARSSGLMEG